MDVAELLMDRMPEIADTIDSMRADGGSPDRIYVHGPVPGRVAGDLVVLGCEVWAAPGVPTDRVVVVSWGHMTRPPWRAA